MEPDNMAKTESGDGEPQAADETEVPSPDQPTATVTVDPTTPRSNAQTTNIFIHELPPNLKRQRDRLEQRRKELREASARAHRLRDTGLLLSAFLIVASLFIAAFGHNFFPGSTVQIVAGVCALYGVSGFALAAVRSGRSYWDLELFDTEQELDLLTFSDASQEQRAERLFKLHQNELKKYYDITRSQSVLIFYVGVACMVMGFAIVIAALYLIATQNADTTSKIIVGAVGAIGSFLSNFVAAIFLRMYSGTVQSLTEFHSRLVGTHHLHYGFFLAAKVSEQNLREKTIADMALVIAKSAGGSERQRSNNRQDESKASADGRGTKTSGVRTSSKRAQK